MCLTSGWFSVSKLLAPLRLPKPMVRVSTALMLRTTLSATGLATPLLPTRVCTINWVPGCRSVISASSGISVDGRGMDALVLKQSWSFSMCRSNPVADSSAPTISLPLFLLVTVRGGALWPKWRNARLIR
ncbi:hypothetical protein FQZ97_1212070 [compost metagenome]